MKIRSIDLELTECRMSARGELKFQSFQSNRVFEFQKKLKVSKSIENGNRSFSASNNIDFRFYEIHLVRILIFWIFDLTVSNSLNV